MEIVIKKQKNLRREREGRELITLEKEEKRKKRTETI
jgi:hypothetical protein